MNTTRSFGPALVLAVTVLAVLLGGPYVMRQLAFAQSEARIQLAAQNLANSRLSELSQAFRDVASVVEPSVVHVAILRKPAERSSRQGGQVPPWVEEFYRQFGLPSPQQPQQFPDEDEYSEFDPMRPVASGSGWVYDTEGHIVTNYHVVREADGIEVILYDKTRYRAEVVGVDPNTDIAVLKINYTNLHPAAMAERSPDQGEIVFAFGSPFGEQFSFSMSQGIVSGKGRRLGILGASGYENFIQTDAAINRGNSGGPLVNTAGEVVGMNSAIATPSMGFAGVGFAIPVEMLQQYIPQLIESGRISRGYLGVRISDDPKLLKSFGADFGAVVDDVLEDSPADEAGVQRGDVVVEVEGREVRDASQLRRIIADYAPGSKVELTVVRNGEREPLEVTLGELPTDMASEQSLPADPVEAEPQQILRKLGIEAAADLDEEVSERLGLEAGTRGVVIGRVRPGSAAAMEGLGRGVIITQVQDQGIGNVEELVAELDKHDLSEGVRISILVRGPGNEWSSHFIVLQLGE